MKSSLPHTAVARTLSEPEEIPTSKAITPTQSYFNRITTPQRAAGHTPTRKTYVYYSSGGNGQSESDTDEEPIRSPFSGTLSRVSGWLRKGTQSTVSGGVRVSPVRTGRHSFGLESPEDGQIQVSDTDHSDIESKHRSPFFLGLRNPSSK